MGGGGGGGGVRPAGQQMKCILAATFELRQGPKPAQKYSTQAQGLVIFAFGLEYVGIVRQALVKFVFSQGRVGSRDKNY